MLLLFQKPPLPFRTNNKTNAIKHTHTHNFIITANNSQHYHVTRRGFVLDKNLTYSTMFNNKRKRRRKQQHHKQQSHTTQTHKLLYRQIFTSQITVRITAKRWKKHYIFCLVVCFRLERSIVRRKLLGQMVMMVTTIYWEDTLLRCLVSH